MTAENYAACYAKIREYEGGNSDLRQDPGGRTSRGITQRVYDAYRRRKGQRTADVWAASEAEVAEIYRMQYWDAVKGDELPKGIDLAVFDGAVNSGPKQAIKWLQSALNTVGRPQVRPITVDGVIGQATLDMVDTAMNHDDIVARICSLRMGFLRNLKGWPTFGKGWSSRVADVKAVATRMAGSAAPVKPSPSPEASAQGIPTGATKATAGDMKTAPVSSATAITTTMATGSLAGATDAIQSAASNIAPVQDVAPLLKYLFIGLTVLGIALALYAAYRETKARKANDAVAVADVPA